MTGNLNLNNNKIVYLSDPTTDQQAANRGWITKLGNPTSPDDAATKQFTETLVKEATKPKPSHSTNEFAYLMSSAAQWTDEIDGGNSYFIRRIRDLSPSKGNFHDYNHKVIFIGINKNSQGGYKYKMGINFYRLTANTDYTLCMEILNTDYQLWYKSQISVDRGNSRGITIGNVSVSKLSHRYLDSKNQPKFMYYHRIIINFRKSRIGLWVGGRYFLHILVNIPQDGTDLAVYPRQFLGVYIITYGIVGTFSNIDPDKVYDYHTAFDVKPTEVMYNVDINANQKEIKNIKPDRNSDNSAATVAMVKELIPFTKNALYRKYFSEFYDFADVNSYGINIVKLNYDKSNNKVTLTVNKTTQNFTMPSIFNAKIIVVWLTEHFDTNVTKASISNYSSTLTIPAVQYNVNQRWKFTTEDGVIIRLMYSPNFYDTDSEQFHKVMIQEKLNGYYVV
ncbi:unnamed protein product [Porites evermanni]|uniref:Allorecognition 2 n=1 Tax=Porites evermanni TaxID=104178 RepID=A0ABN8LQB6_9CNID|nr:unnamed protein product [Porites evermanni]